MDDQGERIDLSSRERQIGLLLFGFSLVLYLATLSWSPFPGLPTQALLMHLKGGTESTVLDPIWGGLVRLLARLPGLSVAGWVGLFSALCGAACVGLLAMLMTRVSYRGMMDLPQDSVRRAAQARGLSGMVAGLYLACCIPFWVVSTRSLPGSFHLLMLLTTAWLLSEFQRKGKWRHLFLMGVLYGVGIVEFSTFAVFFPLMAFLVVRGLFQRRALRVWQPHAAVWGGLLLGLSLYPFNAQVLFQNGVAQELFASPWQAWAQMLQDQALLIGQVRFNAGFLIILLFSMVPWLLLFAMSRRSPWYYESDQIAVRVIFVGGLMAVLYNAPFSPWRLLGSNHLMVTPYLLLAICMGYMAGEFWIVGECQRLQDSSLPRRIVRRVSGAFAWLLPILILVGGSFNWRMVNGRNGGDLHAAALQILDNLAGRDIVFSNGLLDDSLRLAIWERKAPVRLICTPRLQSVPYLRRLADEFADQELRDPLQRGNFRLFLENLFRSDAGVERTAILDLPELFREQGHLVPAGLFYRIVASSDSVDWAAVVAAQRPCWTWMEHLAECPAFETSLARPHQDGLRAMAASVANNLGVLQAERGDETGAMETLRVAHRIHPENLSVLLNLLELGKGRDLPEQAEWEQEWHVRKENPGNIRWALAIYCGYVWRASEWARRGYVWALSGLPTSTEDGRRLSCASDNETEERVHLLDQVYLRWGKPVREENSYRARLSQDDHDTGALMALCGFALRRNDPDMAEAYRLEAMAMGLKEHDTLFDRAMILHVRGDRAKAVAELETLARLSPRDDRIWMALVQLTDERDPLNERAMKILKSRQSKDIGIRLSLAWVHMSRQQWSEAQAELEAAIQLDAKSEKAWEMMVTVARACGNRKLMETSLRTLLAQAPEHPFRRIQKAWELCHRGDWAAAETVVRDGLRISRNPNLLDALADILIQQKGDLCEARALEDEALRKEPFNLAFRCTHIEMNLAEGNNDEAEQGLRQVLEVMPDHVRGGIALIRLHMARGETAIALDLAEALARRKGELWPEQQRQLKILTAQLRNP